MYFEVLVQLTQYILISVATFVYLESDTILEALLNLFQQVFQLDIYHVNSL